MRRSCEPEIVVFRRLGDLGFQLRYGLDFPVKVADCVSPQADEPVATLVCRYFVVHVRLSGKAGVGTAQHLKINPLQPDPLQSRPDIPLPVIVRPQGSSGLGWEQERLFGGLTLELTPKPEVGNCGCRKCRTRGFLGGCEPV